MATGTLTAAHIVRRNEFFPDDVDVIKLLVLVREHLMVVDLANHWDLHDS